MDYIDELMGELKVGRNKEEGKTDNRRTCNETHSSSEDISGILTAKRDPSREILRGEENP